MPTKQLQQPPAPEINPFRRDENAELAKYRARCKDYEEIQLKMEYQLEDLKISNEKNLMKCTRLQELCDDYEQDVISKDEEIKRMMLAY